MHPQREVPSVLDLYRFDGAVRSPALDDQIVRQSIDPLPVKRVHLDFRRSENAGEGAARNQLHGVPRPIALVVGTLRRTMIVAAVLLMHLGMQRAAERDVKLLKSATNTEDGQTGRQGRANQRQRQGIAVRILRTVRPVRRAAMRIAWPSAQPQL